MVFRALWLGSSFVTPPTFPKLKLVLFFPRAGVNPIIPECLTPALSLRNKSDALSHQVTQSLSHSVSANHAHPERSRSQC
jgi:hypothetical protein